MTDNDLRDFLIRARTEGLNKTSDGRSGLIFVKENVAGSSFILDRSDNSVMRTDEQFNAIFEDAGYTILKKFYQEGMPDEIHHISCFVLRPNDSPHLDIMKT